MMKIKINQEVAYALANNLPVVALESTIITHGMPYQKNVEIALKVEEAVRHNGAIPATIGVLDGEAIIGLTEDEIEILGKKEAAIKISRRDLSYVLSQGLCGGTTVAATMFLAAKVGISVFVTGGIGGVHRGAENTMDISSDLEELGRTPIAVISAGPKAILDLPKTLEYLETKGVPIIGYQTSKMPLFYTMSEDEKVLYRLDKEEEIAELILTHLALKLNSGILIFNPIPSQFALPYQEVKAFVDEALLMMDKEGIIGKNQTPYLLSKIYELTGGKSLVANEALIINNAILGAKIAKNMKRNHDENEG
ncbi:MAG: pseudouridine-5'-phosphate glycosidase [Bacilli bacterium]